MPSQVDLDPCEGGYGEDPHVRILDLRAEWGEILSTVKVDVETCSVWCSCYDRTWVDSNRRVSSRGSLLIPC